jgi:hypothetical protein
MTNNNATTKETGMIREFEDSTEAFEADEYEAWLDGQIAITAQAAEKCEAWLDNHNEAPNEKQTMFLWCVFLVTLTYLNSELLYSQSWY